jgi:Cu(I)/Ag(I) efflux system membrane fusion protein
MPVEISLPYAPGRRFEGRVAFVYPSVSPDTRTARVRIELPNPDLALRPDMWATVRLESAAGERLVVPLGALRRRARPRVPRPRRSRSAAGRRSGNARRREVEIPPASRLGGVVASGTFLIASESRLRAALEQW